MTVIKQIQHTCFSKMGVGQPFTGRHHILSGWGGDLVDLGTDGRLGGNWAARYYGAGGWRGIVPVPAFIVQEPFGFVSNRSVSLPPHPQSPA